MAVYGTLSDMFVRNISATRTANGFTLLELLVVVLVIGLVVGLVTPRYFDTVARSKVQIAKAQMAVLEKALEQYRLDTGSLPTTAQGLAALQAPPPGVRHWQGPYLKKAPPADPWGRAYDYRRLTDPRAFVLSSFGEAGTQGGGTTITWPEP